MKKNILYKVDGHSPRCGFFCMFSNICSYLYNQDNNIFIHWGNNRYTYDSENCLDYIFDQNFPENFDSIESSPVNMWTDNVKKYFKTNPSSIPNHLIEFNNFFWSKFAPNEKLKKRLCDLRNIKNNKKTLSVHIRRSDILCETYFLPYLKFDVNNLENYFEIINREYIDGKYEKIFLCTEDENVYNFLKTKFNSDILFYQNVKRVSHEVIDPNSSLEPLYDQSKEEMLLDIMSDVLFASECEGFLGSIFSGVSIFIEIFNNNKFKKLTYF